MNEIIQEEQGCECNRKVSLAELDVTLSPRTATGFQKLNQCYQMS